jgi:transposase-like protein
MGKKKSSSWEFKLQLVHLLEIRTHTMSQASRDYHVTRSLLYAWIRLYQQRPRVAQRDA